MKPARLGRVNRLDFGMNVTYVLVDYVRPYRFITFSKELLEMPDIRARLALHIRIYRNLVRTPRP